MNAELKGCVPEARGRVLLEEHRRRLGGVTVWYRIYFAGDAGYVLEIAEGDEKKQIAVGSLAVASRSYYALIGGSVSPCHFADVMEELADEEEWVEL